MATGGSMPLRLGIDLGAMSDVPAHAAAAAAVGARLARFVCPLAVEQPSADEAYLAAAQQAVDRLWQQGIEPLVVIDSRMTVVPDGPAALGERLRPTLAIAWREELLDTTERLVRAIGHRVPFWEVLPTPNVAARQGLEPALWAELLVALAERIRQGSPQSAIIAGGLRSDDMDDGVDYLRAAYPTARTMAGRLPAPHLLDYLGVQFRILPTGAPSDEILRVALTERIRRLWRAVEQLSAGDALSPRGLIVTSLSWDAERSGELGQATSLARAVEALAAEPAVHGIVWTSLVDGESGASGLFRGRTAVADAPRPAWEAFAEQARRLAEAPASPRPQAAAAPVTTLRFHIPNATQVLEAMGLEGQTLELALAAIRARYGEPADLPPGDYVIEFRSDAAP